MNRLKRLFVCPLLAVVFVLSGCLFDLGAEERHQAELDEKKEIVTDYMETCLNEKYAEFFGMDPSDELFEVYDLSKGGNQAWFNEGVYPAKARCLLDEYDEEFTVELEVERNLKGFGTFKDSFYGILYGDEAKWALEDFVLEYPVTDTQIYYLPSEEIVTEESELRENLYVFGKYGFSTQEEFDELCEFIDKLNELGYQHRIATSDESTNNKSMSGNNNTSDELREFYGM